MSNPDFEITVEGSYDKRGNDAVLIKIATTIVELNVHLQVSHLPKVLSEENSEEFYCVAGESANSLVHWKKESADEVYILVGEDQDVWDICLLIPRETFSEIVSKIRAIHPSP